MTERRVREGVSELTLYNIINKRNRMDIKLLAAVKHWFNKSSYDMVYLEAIANAIDANATHINIRFNAPSESDYANYSLEIEDNGVGFTDERYTKFCSLMDVDEEDVSHRGLGRLVYLFYFKNVHIKSFLPNYIREFDFSEEMTNRVDTDTISEQTGTIISFNEYKLSKLKDTKYIDAKWLKSRILNKFISRLNFAKEIGTPITINIEMKIGDKRTIECINDQTIPLFEKQDFTSTSTLDGNMTILYSVQPCDLKDSSVTTALSIDGRDEDFELFEQPIAGYRVIFVLKCDSFNGGMDDARQSIILSGTNKKALQKDYLEKVREILDEKIPKRKEKRIQKVMQLAEKYPYLTGYFSENEVIVSSDKEVVNKALNDFSRAQLGLLNRSKLSVDDYRKSMEVSGRILTQYILFRQYIVKQLSEISLHQREFEIHNLIVPRFQKYSSETATSDIFSCNLWVFDDKFMTYRTVLSEKDTTNLLRIFDEDADENVDRPDIAVIFSADPSTVEKFDVVIIELKKRGLKVGEKMRVEYQLEQRARALYPYYGDKIQSMWLYGVCDLDDDYEAHLNTAGYAPMYSDGLVYFSTNPIVVQMRPRISVPANRYVMDYNALVNDAGRRNDLFLRIVKESIPRTSQVNITDDDFCEE